MKLAPQQADRFFTAWWPLLAYVNERRRVVPVRPLHGLDSPFTMAEAFAVRNALWADDSVLDAFVADNPAGLPSDLLAEVSSWKHRRSGMFVILKHYKKHTIFMAEREAFAVLGLRSSFEEILPMPPPLLVDAVLLPFNGVTVSDGLLVPKSVMLGPGIRRGLKESYDDAVERGAVRTSLLPGVVVKDEKSRNATNRKVVTAFRRYLLQERRLSEKTVDRDTRIIEVFAKGLAGGRSLRDATADDVEAMLASAATIFGGRAETVAALKRFYKFLVDTGRGDADVVYDVHAWLKEIG